MSRIFDAYRDSGTEPSGIEYSAVLSRVAQLLQAAERGEPTQSESLTHPCHSFGSPVPVGRLFSLKL
jgi:hypothetical protein